MLAPGGMGGSQWQSEKGIATVDACAGLVNRMIAPHRCVAVIPTPRPGAAHAAGAAGAAAGSAVAAGAARQAGALTL